MNDIFMAIRGRLAVSITNSDTIDTDGRIKLKMQAKAEADDGLDDIWDDSNPMPLPSGKVANKRVAGSSASSAATAASEGDDPKPNKRPKSKEAKQ